jgi:hypothetical protein
LLLTSLLPSLEEALEVNSLIRAIPLRFSHCDSWHENCARHLNDSVASRST